jgi:hypothetical protein
MLRLGKKSKTLEPLMGSWVAQHLAHLDSKLEQPLMETLPVGTEPKLTSMLMEMPPKQTMAVCALMSPLETFKSITKPEIAQPRRL